MSEKLNTHPLVEKLSPRPDQSPKLFPIVGFIGPSHRIGYRRVYHDLSLTSHTEVPDDAIKSAEPMDSANEMSPSLILVKRGTKVETHLTARHPVEAGFLDGGIARGYLGATRGRSLINSQIDVCSTPDCVEW